MSRVTIVGDYFSTGSRDTETGVRLINHVIQSDVLKNKIVLQNYLFSLLVEGTKVVHAAHHSIAIDHEKFLLLFSGNYLMTEKITSSDGRFQSIHLFFTQEALNVFFSKYAEIIVETRNTPLEQIQIFTKDQF